jgi:hypothetical protein
MSQDPDATAEAEAATTTVAAATATAPTTTTTSYAGFNLLLLEPGTTTTSSGTGNATSAELTYDARLLTNGGGGGRIRARTLSDAERACGGMSNGVDGEGGDAWPKVVQGRAALRSILDEIEEEDHKDHKDQNQDKEGTSGGPDHEIADADDAADSRLAERLIELLTYVTASCIGFGSFSPMSFSLSSFSFILLLPRVLVLLASPTRVPCDPSIIIALPAPCAKKTELTPG